MDNHYINGHNEHGEHAHAEHHEHHHTAAVKQSGFFYSVARIAAFFFSRIFFKRRVIRNEIKGKKGPFVVIANHEAAYDFVNLIGATRRKMTFVISESFYESVSVKPIIKRMGVIAKQQFQTSLHDIRAMKAVLDEGRILTIYPSGLMCEDGLSTPIPQTTYKFLKWLGCDVYMARTYGTYFAMPKWSAKKRPGKTYIDIYKLFSADELATFEEDEIKRRADEALLFDAYRDQEKMQLKYKGGDNIEGLENVLYMCPNCKSEFTLSVENGNLLTCESCGFAHRADEYGFLHNEGCGEEIRYVSDISAMAQNVLREKILSGDEGEVTLEVEILKIPEGESKYTHAGYGEVTLTREHFHISGVLNGEELDRSIPILTFASLPFAPGKYFELQHSKEIFRCVPSDPRQVTKFVHKVKIFHDFAAAEHEKRVKEAHYI